MKKTVISLILILTLIFTFAACKGNSEDETTTAPETTTASAQQNLDNFLGELESNVASGLEDETFVLQPVEPDTLPEGTEVSVELDSDNKPKEALFFSYFKKIAKDNKFTMSASCSSSVDGMGMDIPLTMSVSGDKFYVSMKAKLSATMSMDVDFIVNGDKGYMVIHNMKAYAATESGDNAFVDGMVGTDFGTMTYKKTTEISSDGQTYTCEEYIGSNGATIKCYFIEGNEKPERIESISDENVAVMKDITFSSEVDESVFELPAGYKNMEGLAGMY